MEYKLTIDGLSSVIQHLANAGGDAKPLIRKAVNNSLLKVQELARLKAPHRTGTLQRSILVENSDLFGEVKVNEKYGIYLEEGTGPFEIRPRNKKALMWPGALHPVKVVHHPGIKARPFFQPAIEEAQPYIQKQFINVFDTIARNIALRTSS